MSAKEEHARNVDMHKMRRQHIELTKQYAALEMECASLKIATKDAFDKCLIMRETLTKQYTDKMNEMKTDFENEKKLLNEQVQKDASLQRARHLESFNDIKRQLESFYAEKTNENNATHEVMMQQLKTERATFDHAREQARREMEEELAQLAQDRHKVNTELEEVRQHVNRELEDLRSRIKRDEQENTIRLVLELDYNREKMKCQLTEERKALVEQFEKEDIEKRQRNDNEIAEMKKQAEFEINEQMKKLEADIQQLNDQRDIVEKKEESIHKLHQELLDELKKKEEEEMSRQNERIQELKNAEEKQISLHNDRMQELKNAEEQQISLHNDRLQELKNKERDELKRLKQKEEEQNQRFFNEIKMINDERALMNKQFDEERERIKQNEHEQNVQFLTQMNLERDKMKCHLEKERQLIANEAAAERQLNAQMLEKASQELENKFKARVAENDAQHNLMVQTINKEREQIKQRVDELSQQKRDNDERFNAILIQQRAAVDATIQKLNDERDALKETDLRRERERIALINETKLEREANAKSNADALTAAKLEQESKFNLAMQKLNDERDKLKEIDLRREKECVALIKETKLEREANAKSNADALTKARLELDAKFNLAMQKLNDEHEANTKSNADALTKARLEQESKFNLAMQKLNDERDALKETDLRREKECMALIKETKLEREANAKSNADALTAAKLEQESKFNLAMKKLNDERNALKETDLRREKECVALIKETKLEREANAKSNADALTKARLELDAKFNLAMKKLNDERDALKETDLRREKECVALIKETKLEREANAKSNADALTKARLELDAKFNLAMKKLNDERDELMENDLRREKEHMSLMKETKLERAVNAKLNADAFIKANLEQESKFNAMVREHTDLFNASVKKLNEEKEMEAEKIRQLKMEVNNIYEEMIKERTMMNKERMSVLEEKRLAEEERNNLVKEYNDIKCERQCQAGLMKSLMNEVEQLNIIRREEQEKHVQIQNHLKQCFETDKPLSKQLHDTVAANLSHLQLISSLDFKDKRVAIYSHYSRFDEVESYNLLTIECIQHYFDYIIILTNCPNKWNMHSTNHNKMYLLNYNMKSDFRNYGVFIMQSERNLMNASCLCLLNDSFVVVDVNAFGQCIKRVFDLSHDFIGLTSSHENVFHLQSFFLHFNASTLKHVMNYFKDQGLPNNHDGAISKYELGISIYLLNHGFSQFAFVSNDDMKIPLNTTCLKWSEVLNETGIIKRQHFFKKYAYKSMSDNDISEVAEKYSYNKHFVNFLKYNNINITTSIA
jgi:hypothetical protein